MYGHLTFSKDSKDWKEGSVSLTRLKRVAASFPTFTEWHLGPGRLLYLVMPQTVKMS